MKVRSRKLVVMILASVAIPAGGLAAQRPQLDVPYVPTPHEVVAVMLEVTRVDSTDVVYDLGSGDGRIIITAARRHGATGLGIDLNPDRVEEGIRNARRAGVEDRVQFRQGDLFDLDLSPASVVTLYLLTDVNLRLRPRLFEQLRPGTRVVSHAFDMGDWRPDSAMVVPYNGAQARVFYWVIPARAAGEWRVAISGMDPTELHLEQRHQLIEGRASHRGEMVGVEDARMHGEEIVLTLVRKASGEPARITLRGRVEGDRMEGVVVETGARWRAVRSGG